MGIVVLVGIDDSDAGRRAVAFARDRAKALDGEVVLAHIIPWSPYSFTTPEENEERPKRRAAELAAAEEQIMKPAMEIVGASLSLGPVIGISDSMLFLMAIPNVLGMYILARSLKKEILGYRANVADGTIQKVAEH